MIPIKTITTTKNEVTHMNGKLLIINFYFEVHFNIFFFLDSKGLHRAQNPSKANATISLHVYFPPYNTCYKFDDKT